MSERHVARGLLALPVLAALLVLLFWGFSGVPPFGHFHGWYGKLLTGIALPDRHTTNTVTAVVFDYRGFDTLGEEFILFAAVCGVLLLLRAGGTVGEKAPALSEQLRLVGFVLIGAVFVVGLWVVAFGLVTPGGGFQGGVVIAGALLLVFLSQGYGPWQRLANEHAFDPLEGLGSGVFVALGLGALVAGLSFLQNVLGPGKPGTLLSGGSMGLLNWGTAIEVTAATTVLFNEFVQQYLVSPSDEDEG